jgi:acetyl esterase/lipase
VAPSAKVPENKKPDGPEVPPGVAFVPDQTYCTLADGSTLKLDVAYPKKGIRPFPTVVLFHGAGLSPGRSACRPLQWKLAAEGYLAAAVGYRKEAKHRFPSQVHEAKAAVRWLRANAEQYPIDKDRIAAVGYSAGGHLACLLGVTTSKDGLEGDLGHADQSSAVQAVVSYYGPTDLASLHKDLATGGPLDVPQRWLKTSLEAWLGGTPEQQAERYRQASPISYARRNAPPTLLLHGTADRLVPCEQSRQYARKLREAGAAVELLELKEAPHNCTSKHEEKADAAMLGFLAQQLKERPRAGIRTPR